jgi:aerobic carbon-monoxide dehydrogenase medium subunit
MSAVREVLMPTSEAEAVELFGDGVHVTVVGGGTIVVPAVALGRIAPSRAMFLHRAGLSGISRNGSTVTIGATTSVAALADLAAPLGPCSENVADPEVRAQATVGGNICASGTSEVPRGDLQGAFLALDAEVRSDGAGGERTESLEHSLRARDGRLLLSVSYEEPAAGVFERLRDPHTHTYTVLAVSAVRAASGEIRLAVTGSPAPTRLRSAERVADDPAAAGDAALADASFEDDALASAWYRTKTLPVLVRRALTKLEESA